MIRKILLIFLIIVSGISGFAYFKYYEKDHVGLSSVTINKKWQSAKPDCTLLHNGDLIFRHGRGAISNMLMAFSQHEAKYSHAGIISIEKDKVYVYHAIGGEENVSNKLRKDLLQVFCNPNDVHSFGIYRMDLTDQQLNEVDSIAEKYYQNGLEFDTKFDFDTNEKMYCSEFVYKVIVHVAGNENYLSLSTVSGMKYVACDNLYLNAHCRNIYSYNY